MWNDWNFVTLGLNESSLFSFWLHIIPMKLWFGSWQLLQLFGANIWSPYQSLCYHKLYMCIDGVWHFKGAYVWNKHFFVDTLGTLFSSWSLFKNNNQCLSKGYITLRNAVVGFSSFLVLMLSFIQVFLFSCLVRLLLTLKRRSFS